MDKLKGMGRTEKEKKNILSNRENMCFCSFDIANISNFIFSSPFMGKINNKYSDW